MILEKEEMLHNKEIEFDRKEKWLRQQAEMQQQIKTANHYEEELNKRKISAEEKLFILRRREQQLDRVEQTLMTDKQKQPESTLVESKRKAMNRNWYNQKANPALNTKYQATQRRKNV